jgi:NAD+ synthetase
MAPLAVALCQINPVHGDIRFNAERIIGALGEAVGQGAQLAVFPELATTGYMIRDLIFREGFVDQNLRALEDIATHCGETVAIVGCVTAATEGDLEGSRRFYNSAAVLHQGRVVGFAHKTLLPEYDVFEEHRYFRSGPRVSPVQVGGRTLGIEICEDAWDESYSTKVSGLLCAQGAQILVGVNASPFVPYKQSVREAIVKSHARTQGVPAIYVNQVGGQEELVFDGNSFVCDSRGEVVHRCPGFQECVEVVHLDVGAQPKGLAEAEDTNARLPSPKLGKPPIPGLGTDETTEDATLAEIWAAVVLNLRDYYEKNGFFKGIVLGLSGGIDSALTAALAVDAVGPDRVHGILMPSRFSSDHSVTDAQELAQNLGMTAHLCPIRDIHLAFEGGLHATLGNADFGLPDENLQSRIRGNILMYHSNRYSTLLLSTGNKSETAVGYCTLYGDTNGGKNHLADLYKTQVYALARWYNRRAGRQVIPRGSIEKPPSAELRPDQVDQDSLPPYDLLDEILYFLIEGEASVPAIIARGYDEAVVRRVFRLFLTSEFKRAQLPQTVKVSSKTFGIGRRYPVVARYQE